MDAVTPRLTGQLVTVASDQPQYTPVKAIFCRDLDYPVNPGRKHNTVVMAFQPTPQERMDIANGGDVYVSLLTYGEDQQPILVTAGPENMAHWYGLTAVRERVPVAIDNGNVKQEGVKEMTETGDLRGRTGDDRELP